MKASLDFLLTKNLFVRKKTGQDINKYYNFENIIGKGAYGICYKVKMVDPPYKERVVKLLLKSKIKEPSVLINEVSLIREMDHHSIVRIYEVFEDQRSVAIVMDLCEGGELFDLLDLKGPLSEDQARYVFRQMLNITKYMHEHNIAHRDLKPENFLLLKKESLDIILIDFGMAFKWKNDMRKELFASKFSLTAGTSYYMAPQVVKTTFQQSSYSEQCDIWSLGTLLYTMLAAYPPFDGEEDEQIFENILKGKFTLQSEDWKNKSEQVKDLIKKILTVEGQRPSISEIEKHQWMKQPQIIEKHNPEQHETLKFEKIKSFSVSSKLKVLISEFLASQLSAKQTEKYTKIFKEIDEDSNGELTLTEISRYFKRNKQSFKLSDLVKALELADTDKNGKISFNEFIACCLESTILHNEDYLQYVFKSLDKDSSGKISAQEFRQILENNSAQVVRNTEIDALIKECDKNGDGEIDFMELVNSIKSSS